MESKLKNLVLASIAMMLDTWYESFLGDKLDIEIGCRVEDDSLTFEKYIGIATH